MFTCKGGRSGSHLTSPIVTPWGFGAPARGQIYSPTREEAACMVKSSEATKDWSRGSAEEWPLLH
jgi:hypothetical protein